VSSQVGRWLYTLVGARSQVGLGGVLTFRIAGRTIEAPVGTFILVPRGTAHGFGNLGSGPASFLALFSPAGMEGYFEERFALARGAPGEATRDYAGLDETTHTALARKYHMEFVPSDSQP
jgi:hypothetical protein